MKSDTNHVQYSRIPWYELPGWWFWIYVGSLRRLKDFTFYVFPYITITPWECHPSTINLYSFSLKIVWMRWGMFIDLFHRRMHR